jgi:cysteine-rich repeat protein
MAHAATRLLRVGFRARTKALNRIASISLVPSEKIRIVAQSTAVIEHARLALLARLEQACPAEQFMALYAHDASDMLTLIAQRADCLGGAAYVQGAILCPAAVCGNTMVEPGEQCDDGNTLSGDGCSAACQVEGTQ